MKKTLILFLLSLPVVAWGQFRLINPDSILYGKQPKNDTVAYAIEVFTTQPSVRSEWHRVRAVRHYELLPYDCGLNSCQRWQPIIDFYIYDWSKQRIKLKIIRSIAL